MKRLFIFMLICSMVFSLFGCGKNNLEKPEEEMVTVGDYQTMEITKPEKVTVTEEEVDSEIASSLEAEAEYKEVTRAAKDTDTVNFDMKVSCDGKDLEDETKESTEVELGSDSMFPANGDYQGLEDQIAGHKKGDTFQATVKAADDHETLAGKVLKCEITVNAVKEKHVPELTDQWVKENSEKSETVDEYKKEVKKSLQSDYDEQYEAEYRTNAWIALLEIIDAKELDEEKVEKEYDYLTSEYKSQASMLGVTFKEFLSTYMGMTEDEFKEQAKEAAEQNVSLREGCRLIAEKENLIPSKKEYRAQYEEMAESYGYDSAEDLIKEMGEDVLQGEVLKKIVAEWLIGQK